MPCSKAVDFGDDKVLLSKVKGKIYATSAFCTHVGARSARMYMLTMLQYGAPLESMSSLWQLGFWD